MKRNRWQENPQGLEPLAAQATEYALHMMRTTGSVPPTVIADTDEGYVFCMPTALTDDAAKDRFAEVTRLFAVAQSARAIVMIAEAWARLPDANGHLDTETPPSQAPDRKEVVVLMLEDHSRNATVMLPIFRDAFDAFTSFGDPGPMQFGESTGRFSGLMPRDNPCATPALCCASINRKSPHGSAFRANAVRCASCANLCPPNAPFPTCSIYGISSHVFRRPSGTRTFP